MTGPFTLTSARLAGYSDAQIRRQLRQGAWTALRRGIYVATSELEAAPNKHAPEVAGLMLTLGFTAVAGGTSAARIWDLDTLTAPSREVVVVTDAAVTARRREGYTVRTAALPAHHRSVRHGVPVTSLARTAVDMARALSFAEGVVVVDSALRSGASRQDLEQVLRDCYLWRGIRRAQQVVAFADPRSESALESLSRVAMRETQLPMPQTQVVLRDELGPCGRVDFLWDEVGVIGEADGLAKYEPDGRRTTREIVAAEKLREERLADAGYEILRWGWADARNPPRLANRLRAAFARGSQRRRWAS